MELFENPETFYDLTMSEKLAGAGITALMGMGITFAILIILWGCIVLMNKILYRPKKQESASKAPAPAAAAKAPAAEPATDVAPAASSAQENAQDEEALIAVISAAIAAYEGEGVASNLTVRKIKRVGGLSTTWAAAGRNECIESRKI